MIKMIKQKTRQTIKQTNEFKIQVFHFNVTNYILHALSNWLNYRHKTNKNLYKRGN